MNGEGRDARHNPDESARGREITSSMIPGLTGYAAWVADGVLARDARIRREARTRDERAPREGAQQDPREVAPRRAHQVSVFEGGREVELPTRPLRVQPPQPVRNQQRIPVQQHPTASRARSGSALNPTAMPFRPVDASIASQPAILREPPPPPAYRYPETGVRPHLVYTEINHVRAPTMHPARVVIPRLRELPDDYIQEDGSVELHLQWVIAQAGYAHFEAGGNGRAQLVQDSWIRFDGRVYGLSGEIIRWLAGEIPGGILRVSVQDAARFWGPHLAARGRESESSLK